MDDSHCPIEFGTLSDSLLEQFGVHTHFRLADGAAPPDLKHKGEQDMPDDDALNAES